MARLVWGLVSAPAGHREELAYGVALPTVDSPLSLLWTRARERALEFLSLAPGPLASLSAGAEPTCHPPSDPHRQALRGREVPTGNQAPSGAARAGVRPTPRSLDSEPSCPAPD